MSASTSGPRNLGPDKSADDELHLSETPSRVDFVLVAEGRKV
jgi:hypothetical protein